MRREAVVRDLRRLAARLGRPVSEEDLPTRLRTAVAQAFASLARARKAAGLPAPPRAPRWTRERVVRELRALKGRAAPHGVSWAARKLFGSAVADARRAAGLEVLRRQWTASDTIAALRAAARHGEPLSALLSRWCHTHFGSMAAARTAAGLPQVRTPWDRARVVAALRAAAAEKRPPGSAVLTAAQRYFGSISAARASAGLQPAHVAWSCARVLAQLRARGGAASDANLSAACVRYFGSVNAARAAAGLPCLRKARWSRAELVAELRRIGTGPISIRLMSACATHFGSVAAGRRAAGQPAPRRAWTRAEVVGELRRTAGNASGKNGLRAACARHFGSLDAARIAAGVLPSRGRGAGAAAARRPRRVSQARTAARAIVAPGWVQRWTRERILEELRRCGGRRPAATLSAACVRHFGSLDAARDVAGLAGTGKLQWTAAKALERLRAGGATPVDGALGYACARFFGSVKAARRAAHVPPARKRWTEAAMLEELRARARGGAVARAAEFSSAFKKWATRAFGSLEAACATAGVAYANDNAHHTAWTRDKLLEALRALAAGKDRMGHKDVPARVHQAARRFFRGVAAACDVAGLAYGRPNRATARMTEADPRTALLDALRTRGDGRLPVGLAASCRALFGSVGAARRAAQAASAPPEVRP
jgi:hypothetical protein